ncbi:MAG TPA: iron-containing redox enzyme family protein [Solirubrobacterales bacterium]|nr:iron-containing redox enzyme family protein [Solirubrobacterales bacterium]
MATRTRNRSDELARSDPRPSLPHPRGSLSEELISILLGGSRAGGVPSVPADPSAGGVFGEDFQLALYLLYELHYRGFRGVAEELEWDPALLGLRAALEADFEARIREELPLEDPPPEGRRIAAIVLELIRADDGPGLATRIETTATLDQVREFLIHRSAYQLKEADPHSWAIPRLSGPAKAALVEVQADEYGGGRPDRIHATLFAKAMLALGLDPAYGAYLDRIPAVTLATVNLMSLFGLHRRLRGAIVGHLAAFEITSPIPNSRYAKGLRRLGAGEDALDFFDEHVEADSVHENIALYDMAEALAIAEPGLASDILLGVRSLLLLDARFAAHVLERWDAGASSLLAPASAAP